ncbi:MAG: phosphate ABC transporter permease PstA [Acidimicrobiia bacterium]|nr:phosphate ABC transporter permease PstA [Acidimicrobiia bacterium]
MATVTSSTNTTTDLVRGALEGKRVNVVNSLVSGLLLVALLSSLVVLAVLLTDVFIGGWGLLTERGTAFLTEGLSPDAANAGILQGVMGSIALTVVVIVVSFPLGVAAAIYLEEYAPTNRVTTAITTNIRNLAGVPSIVYGLLGLTVFVNVLTGITGGRTVVTGGLTLALLVLPIMIITTSEALRAVPSALREASMGVGATRWETIRHHVLPVAIPAILTGSVLTIARAFGETAPLLLSGAVLSLYFSVPDGVGFVSLMTEQSYTSLPMIIYNWARQPQEEFVALTSAAIIVLLVMLLIVNAAAIIARDYFERKSL